MYFSFYATFYDPNVNFESPVPRVISHYSVVIDTGYLGTAKVWFY